MVLKFRSGREMKKKKEMRVKQEENNGNLKIVFIVEKGGFLCVCEDQL